ncbi:30S ribosomal protein S7 [Candidatus Margulisiibacteriota bacterium]
MSRRNRAQKRIVGTDSRFNSALLQQFINKLMLRGRKTVAERVIYAALDKIKETTGDEPLSYFEKALSNVVPQMEVKSRRVGGANYQVPIEVDTERGKALAIRWIITYARQHKGVSMTDGLFQEIMDAYNSTGAAMKKREDTHKMAAANKAFSHFRW